ncbi:hypothetical protein AUEXF2481DRAFT_560581 [Aureobasidium subglaciale EXF-2481]|uniref:Uncharacterized protein n=1 Tax=Aureobasidium subglaciale (strain EXF-2481) TaxID=1043005 RepID=A0A074YJW1_AURSE|nr:uncharacterized protein AUEXF2481DRAFT_560581 [Aureobasidium subglaciale EXF-2481]KEQ97990.1 hypothetical protein AUEXF2481DRAFT_560581 [Aureobasidium subglaciale EXF-2481]
MRKRYVSSTWVRAGFRHRSHTERKRMLASKVKVAGRLTEDIYESDTQPRCPLVKHGACMYHGTARLCHSSCMHAHVTSSGSRTRSSICLSALLDRTVTLGNSTECTDTANPVFCSSLNSNDIREFQDMFDLVPSFIIVALPRSTVNAFPGRRYTMESALADVRGELRSGINRVGANAQSLTCSKIILGRPISVCSRRHHASATRHRWTRQD